MPIPSEQELFDAACHLGHPHSKWNPKMKPFIFGIRKGIHIFDLSHTKQHLEQVCAAMKKLQNEGKTILFVSTKQQSIPMIERMGQALNQPTVTKKWIPGLLTNWRTLKQRLKYYLNLQNSFKTGDVEKYTKKEQLELRKKLTKLDSALGGVSQMTQIPDAIFIVDAVRDHVATAEAKKLKIAVYGICDSNANPEDFTGFIPANDDAVRSLTLILATIEQEIVSQKAKRQNEELSVAA